MDSKAEHKERKDDKIMEKDDSTSRGDGVKTSTISHPQGGKQKKEGEGDLRGESPHPLGPKQWDVWWKEIMELCVQAGKSLCVEAVLVARMSQNKGGKGEKTQKTLHLYPPKTRMEATHYEGMAMSHIIEMGDVPLPICVYICRNMPKGRIYLRKSVIILIFWKKTILDWQCGRHQSAR